MMVQLGITADVSWRLVCLCQRQHRQCEHWGQEIPTNKEKETEKACDCEKVQLNRARRQIDCRGGHKGKGPAGPSEKEKHFEQDMEEMINKRG